MWEDDARDKEAAETASGGEICGSAEVERDSRPQTTSQSKVLAALQQATAIER